MKKEFCVIKFLSIIGFLLVVLCGCSSANKNVSDETVQITTEEVTTSAETTTVETTEAETTTEATEAESKSIEDYIKDAARIAGFTDEEVESIAEDARVYEAYGSDAETAFDMAMKDVVYGKSNGQQDYAVTLPQVVDENGNPYPTDEYGGVIIPETTAPEETTQVAENETPTSEKPYAGLEITLENDNEEYGYNLKVYGDYEYFVITEDNGTVHEYDNLTEARNCLSIIEFEKRKDPDLIEWDGTLSDKDTMTMTDEELRISVNDPNAVHGKVY